MLASYITSKADELIQDYGERNPYYIAEQLGVIIKYKDLGSLKGAYFGNMKIPVIVINEALDENIRSMVCAHELGHHILHNGQIVSCDDINSRAILEREANIFASAFLIDSEKALNLLNMQYSISEVASIMQIDENLLLFLLNSLNLTDAPDSTFLKS